MWRRRLRPRNNAGTEAVKQHVKTSYSHVRTVERITAVAKWKVEGVGFQHFAARYAHMSGVHGYVRNMPDGSVTMVADISCIPGGFCEEDPRFRGAGDPS